MKLPDGLNNLINRVGRNNLVAVVCILILLVLGFILLRSNIANPFNQNKSTVGGPITTPTPRPTTVPGDTIMITFKAVPASLNTKVGKVINFINFSGVKIDIEGVDDASKILNVGVLQDSDTSKEILMTKAGTYKYIDKLNPKITGEIIVAP